MIVAVGALLWYDEAKGVTIVDIRSLQYFQTIADKGSISGAAEQLHMTQPPLSRQLKLLEEELGTPLFNRAPGARSMSLTPSGEKLYQYATNILRLTQHLRENILLDEREISGDVTIGAAESRGMDALLRAIQAVHRYYPRICFHFKSGNAAEVSRLLDTGTVDFGVFVSSFDASAYHAYRLPDEDQWGLLMRKDSPLAERKTVSPPDLWDRPLILDMQSLQSTFLSSWLRRDYSELNITGTYDLLYNASLLVESGLGDAVCIKGLVDTGESSGLCFRPFCPALKSSLMIAWHRNPAFSSAASLFLRAVLKECGSAMPENAGVSQWSIGT